MSQKSAVITPEKKACSDSDVIANYRPFLTLRSSLKLLNLLLLAC